MHIITKRYVTFFLSILVIGTGITLITNAGLGATAVTSLPFVISELYDWGFGTLTTIFNLVWILLQILILRRDFNKIQFLQFLVAPLLGFAIDFSNLILGFMQSSHYFIQLILLIIGCIIMAVGICLQLQAQVIYNPAEGIVAAISTVTKQKFGNIKISFDILLVVLSIILGLAISGSIVGIREGTLISALIIGPITNLLQKYVFRK